MGMKILFVLSVIQVFWYCFCAFEFSRLGINLIGWFLVQVFVQSMAVSYFYFGLKEDTIRTRYYLMRACRLELIAAVFVTIGTSTFLYNGNPASTGIGIVSIALCIYWLMVSARYLRQA